MNTKDTNGENTESKVKQGINMLCDAWNAQYEKAGRPTHYCPNERLYWAIVKGKSALGCEIPGAERIV